MSVSGKADFYSNKKLKPNLEIFYTNDEKLSEKLDELSNDLKKGFMLYTKRNMERFIQGQSEISDFAEQFVKLYEYYQNNNKYANTEELFCILYGKTLGIKKWQNKKAKIQGENNPWYNHAGKLSPWKKGSVNYSEESIKKANQNRSYNTRIEYYTDKGYSEEESKILLKERQATGRLDKFINRYGEDEGIKKWKERQEKWQNTLKSKPQKEIDEINKRKSSGIGRYLDRNIPGKLYYIHFFNNDIDFWKIGITSKTINERFNLEKYKKIDKLDSEIIFEHAFDTIQEAYEKEQHILAIFDSNRIIFNGCFYTTEAFNTDVLRGFYEII